MRERCADTGRYGLFERLWEPGGRGGGSEGGRRGSEHLEAPGPGGLVVENLGEMKSSAEEEKKRRAEKGENVGESLRTAERLPARVSDFSRGLFFFAREPRVWRFTPNA